MAETSAWDYSVLPMLQKSSSAHFNHLSLWSCLQVERTAVQRVKGNSYLGGGSHVKELLLKSLNSASSLML